MVGLKLPTMAEREKEYRLMDLDHIKHLRKSIKWLKDYEKRTRYTTLPSFKFIIERLKNELKDEKDKYNRDWVSKV